MREKYESSQKSWLEARYELDLKESKYNTNETSRKQLEHDASHYKLVYIAFREQVAGLMSDEYMKVKADETEILEKLAVIMNYMRDRARVVTCLENRIELMTKELSDEVSLKEKHKLEHELSLTRINELVVNTTNLEARLNDNNVSLSNLNSDRLKVF